MEIRSSSEAEPAELQAKAHCRSVTSHMLLYYYIVKSHALIPNTIAFSLNTMRKPAKSVESFSFLSFSIIKRNVKNRLKFSNISSGSLRLLNLMYYIGKLRFTFQETFRRITMAYMVFFESKVG